MSKEKGDFFVGCYLRNFSCPPSTRAPLASYNGAPIPIYNGKIPGTILNSYTDDQKKENRYTGEIVYDASLKSAIGPIRSTPERNFPPFPINLPYPYSHPSFARCRSRIPELMYAVPAVSSSASLA